MLYHLYTVKGERGLLAAAVLVLAMGFVDALILPALLGESLGRVARLASLAAAAAPGRYGVAVEAPGFAVVSMEVPGGLAAVRVGGYLVEGVRVESPRLAGVSRWPRVPLGLLRPPTRPGGPRRAGCPLETHTAEGAAVLPDPASRRLLRVEGLVRYAGKRCDRPLDPRDVEEVLGALGLRGARGA